MNKKLYFFGGKGGTGKTSLSSAYALKLANEGQEVLAVSTDPAHSLGDAFGTALTDRPKKLRTGLWALEVNAAAEARAYVAEIKERMQNLVSPGIVEDLNRQLDQSASSPGSEEAALFDRFSSLMALAGDRYDAVVFDTAPTGHTLRLLELPESLELWMTHLMGKRKASMDLMRHASHYEKDLQEKLRDDPLMAALSRRRTQFFRARTLLIDPNITTFFLVAAAEKLPVLETERAIGRLQTAGIPLGPVIINKLLPPESGEWFAPLRERQAYWLNQASTRFTALPVKTIPLLQTDVESVETLQCLAHHLSDL